MKEIILTCPFTGLPFKATEYVDGKLVFIHPLTHEAIHMNYNSSIKKYNIERKAFTPIEICTQAQAMEILGLSRQRVNKIAQDDVIPTYSINGSNVFLMSDVLSYKETRRPGRPEKG